MADHTLKVLTRILRRVGQEAGRCERSAKDESLSSPYRDRMYGEANQLRWVQGVVREEMRKAKGGK